MQVFDTDGGGPICRSSTSRTFGQAARSPPAASPDGMARPGPPSRRHSHHGRYESWRHDVWDDGGGRRCTSGGQFKLAGGVVANSIAKWTHRLVGLGKGIHELAIGRPGHVYALAGYQGKLYVGGYYYGAGDSDTGRASSAVGARRGWENPAPTASTVRFWHWRSSRQAVRRRRMHQMADCHRTHRLLRRNELVGRGTGLVGGGGEALTV